MSMTDFQKSLEDSSLPDNYAQEITLDGAALTIARKNQPSTRVSLLVEALVRSVVTAYESNTQRASRAYRKICRRLFQMGLIDESWSMTELEGARAQFAQAMFQLFKTGSQGSPNSPLSLHGAFYTSHYKKEFEELEKIGGGAFGKVFRVKHKLDGNEYAVKKIPIHSEGIDSVKKYLSEVKTFASLNHPNIVQYKAAWFELGSPINGANSSWVQPKLTISAKNITDQFVFNKDILSSISFTPNDSPSDSSFEIEFKQSPNGTPIKELNRAFSDDSQPSIPINSEQFVEISTSTMGNKTDNDSGDGDFKLENSSFTEKSSPTEKAVVPAPNKPKIRWATLYIQMALCHGTLGHWLRRRNDLFKAEVAVTSSGAEAFRTKAILQILIQILRGLKYIHSKGIVHHDIKPSNIFVSAEGGSLLVQLGDFGLACPLQRARHGFARGTPLYAAPEQLAGCCDPKSDIYSMGIVLFELLEDFSTDMERTRKISKLRARTDPPIPPDFSLSNLVSAMVRRRAAERPDASTLLETLEGGQKVTRPDLEVLQQRLNEKDKEIEKLRKLLRDHGVQGI